MKIGKSEWPLKERYETNKGMGTQSGDEKEKREAGWSGREARGRALGMMRSRNMEQDGRNNILSKALAAALALALAGCAAVPGAQPVPPGSPEAQRVRTALAAWPKAAGGAALRRPFHTELDAAGARITAEGMLAYYGPRDFQITAMAEGGALLFDGRANWAGVRVLRQTPEIAPGIVEALLEDLERAFDPPEDLQGLKAGDEKMVLARHRGDDREYTWIFDRGDGRLREATVTQGLDMLHVTYRGYSARGWPEELQVTHWTRGYEASFSFTEGSAQVEAGK